MPGAVAHPHPGLGFLHREPVNHHQLQDAPRNASESDSNVVYTGDGVALGIGQPVCANAAWDGSQSRVGHDLGLLDIGLQFPAGVELVVLDAFVGMQPFEPVDLAEEPNCAGFTALDVAKGYELGWLSVKAVTYLIHGDGLGHVASLTRLRSWGWGFGQFRDVFCRFFGVFISECQGLF